MPPIVTRRAVLAGLLGTGAAVGLGACSRGTSEPTLATVGPGAIASAAVSQSTSGRTRTLKLVAQPAQVDLGGRVVDTWTYGGLLPGTLLRANAGDRVTVAFANRLPTETSVHWHGLAIRNDMDGVPDVTTPATPAGGSFTFDFVVPDPGTHWFHPHHGLQLDRGLYAPFIVDDPAEPGAYDAEWIVVLDDWTDGVGPSPEQILRDLQGGGTAADDGGDGTGDMGMGGMGGSDIGMGGSDMGGMGGSDMGMGDTGGMGGGGMGISDGGDVAYPMYLVNGRTSSDPYVMTAKPGQRVRLRIINAAADTLFTVALADHRLQITHTDGYPVTPLETSAVTIGMGERYDAVVTLNDGVFPLVAEPVGKSGLAHALIRTGAGRAPAAGARPKELDTRAITVGALQVAAGSALPAGEPDTVQDVVLTGSMTPYVWRLNGRTYDEAVPLTIQSGQRGRLRMRNMSMMPHPMHLHGHTFQLGAAGGRGPRKDTVLIPPMGGVAVELVADNPGHWMLHCHNVYHMAAGMMTRLEYVG